jgi:hypothetical protein
MDQRQQDKAAMFRLFHVFMVHVSVETLQVGSGFVSDQWLV